MRHPSNAVLGPWRRSPLVAPRARELGTPTRSGVGSLGSNGPASQPTHGHLTSATGHERALTSREFALRAVAAVGADRHHRNSQRQRHHARVPSQESPPYVRGRLARRGHHHAPRAALARAAGAGTNRAGGRRPRGRTASGSASRCASRWSVSSHAEVVAPFSGRSGQPRVDSTTTVHRCWSTRGYHAWTKRITVLAAGSKAKAGERYRPSRAAPAAW